MGHGRRDVADGIRIAPARKEKSPETAKVVDSGLNGC
jgi:hypothetical protein